MVIVNRSVAVEHGRGRVTPIAHIFLDILVTRIKKGARESYQISIRKSGKKNRQKSSCNRESVGVDVN